MAGTKSAAWVLMALALGACAAQPASRPSPMFESDVRTTQADAAPARDTSAAPAPPLPGGSAQTKTEYAAICDELRRYVGAEVQDIDGGARLLLRASSEPAWIRLRRTARELEHAAAGYTGASQQPPCALFELAEQGATFHVREDGDHLLVEVTGEAELRAAVRTGLRRYVETTRPPTERE